MNDSNIPAIDNIVYIIYDKWMNRYTNSFELYDESLMKTIIIALCS